MTRQTRAAIMAAALICSDDGEVPGGTEGLRRALGLDSVFRTRDAIRQACAWGYMRRYGPNGERLVLCLSRLSPKRCDTCGRALQLGPHAKESRCIWCRQTIHRADRGWRGLALQTWATARASGLSEAQAIYRVSAVTKLRLYGSTVAETKAGEQPRPALVPWMVQEGMIDPKWLTYATRWRGDRPDIWGMDLPEVEEDAHEG